MNSIVLASDSRRPSRLTLIHVNGVRLRVHIHTDPHKVDATWYRKAISIFEIPIDVAITCLRIMLINKCSHMNPRIRFIY